MFKPLSILPAVIALLCVSAPVFALKPSSFANSPASCDWINAGGHAVRPPGLCENNAGPEDFSPSIDTASIPEPSTLALLCAGAASVAVRKWRTRKSL